MPTVLVVEDDPAMSAFLEAALEDVGDHVQTAVDGATLQLAHDQPPDVILLDLMTPLMDGLEVNRRLRADRVTAGIPIMAMSAAQRLAALAGRMRVDD